MGLKQLVVIRFPICLFLILMVSCTNPEGGEQVASTTDTTNVERDSVPVKLRPENELPDAAIKDQPADPSFDVFSLGQYGLRSGEVLCFVSLAEGVADQEQSDWGIIPSTCLGDVEVDHDTLLSLTGTHRQAALAYAGFAETDSLFVYSLIRNQFIGFEIAQLPIIAFSNPYGVYKPVTDGDYVFGFQLSGAFIEQVRTDYEECLVAVAETNPFHPGGAVAIDWQAIESDAYPAVKEPYLDQFTPAECFSSSWGELNFYSRVFKKEERVEGLQVLVFRGKEKVYQAIYRSGEGTDPVLPQTHENLSYRNWTGHLFKGMPPMMHGFYYQAFGCPEIRFVGDPNLRKYISCDNRH